MTEKQLSVVQNNITSLAQWSDLQTRSEYLAKSELIPSALRGKPANIAIILQIGCELGISPMQAITGVTVIQGKPGVDPQLAIALIRRECPTAFIKVETCEDPGKESAKVTMARSREFMDEAYTATWNMDKARKMDLATKDNYKKQPGVMLRWRATMEAARFVFPDVLRGMYSPDELDGIGADAPPSETSEDKAKRISERLAAAKVVTSEVVPPSSVTSTAAPIVMPPEVKEPEAPAFNPLGDYVWKSGPPFQDRRLAEIEHPTLIAYLDMVEKTAQKNNRPITGLLLQDLTRADEYLYQSGQNRGSFASFGDVKV